MGKYRKKPVVVDAFKWTGGPDQEEDPKWAVDALRSGKMNIIDGELFINTLEGVMQARAGDYIVRGIQGEIYLCKPDIFEASHEPSDEEGDS